MQYPDVIGYTLEEAVCMLSSNEFSYTVNYYQPPKESNNKLDNQKAIIVRVKNLSEKHLELTVCDI